MYKDLEWLGKTWKNLKGLGRTWKDLKGLVRTRKDNEGLERTCKNLKGLGRTWKYLKGLERSWENFKWLECWECDRQSDRLTSTILERHAPLKMGMFAKKNPQLVMFRFDQDMRVLSLKKKYQNFQFFYMVSNYPLYLCRAAQHGGATPWMGCTPPTPHPEILSPPMDN